MKWETLVTTANQALYRGNVFRCCPKQTGDMDLLLMDNPDSPSGFSLVRCCGYKSGLVLVHLPTTALVSTGEKAVSRDWMIANWDHWVAMGSIATVAVVSHYEF